MANATSDVWEDKKNTDFSHWEPDQTLIENEKNICWNKQKGNKQVLRFS